jgi:hypothetical protein
MWTNLPRLSLRLSPRTYSFCMKTTCHSVPAGNRDWPLSDDLGADIDELIIKYRKAGLADKSIRFQLLHWAGYLDLQMRHKGALAGVRRTMSAALMPASAIRLEAGPGYAG